MSPRDQILNHLLDARSQPSRHILHSNNSFLGRICSRDIYWKVPVARTQEKHEIRPRMLEPPKALFDLRVSMLTMITKL